MAQLWVGRGKQIESKTLSPCLFGGEAARGREKRAAPAHTVSLLSQAMHLGGRRGGLGVSTSTIVSASYVEVPKVSILTLLQGNVTVPQKKNIRVTARGGGVVWVALVQDLSCRTTIPIFLVCN